VRVTLAVLLFVAVIGCRRSPSPTVFLDPALAVLVPRDTTMLAGIRMQRLRSTSFYSEYVANSPRLLQFRENSGLQRDADVWEYLIASNGSNWIALMRGKFSEMGMEPRSTKSDALRITYRGANVVGDERGAIAFLNPTTAIAGPLESVKKTLDERNWNNGVPETLQQLTREIPSTNEAWLVSSGPAPPFVKSRPFDALRAAINAQMRTYEERIKANRQESTRSGPIPADVLAWVLGKPE